jgi:hypothetical protein
MADRSIPLDKNTTCVEMKRLVITLEQNFDMIE